MRTLRFLFAMIVAAVLLPETSLASQSTSVPQQSPSQSRETSGSSEAQTDSQVGREKNQTGAGHSDVGQNNPEPGTRHVIQPRPNQSHVKPALGHQVRSDRTPVARSLRRETLENGVSFHQMESTTSSGVPNKTVSHYSAPVPAATVAVNGQQFRNTRDPGARLAVSGGSLSATRGTAAINGSNMKRKP